MMIDTCKQLGKQCTELFKQLIEKGPDAEKYSEMNDEFLRLVDEHRRVCKKAFFIELGNAPDIIEKLGAATAVAKKANEDIKRKLKFTDEAIGYVKEATDLVKGIQLPGQAG